MKKTLQKLWLLAIILTAGVTSAWGADSKTYTWTAASGDLGSSGSAYENPTLNGKSWTESISNDSYLGWSSNHIQIGSKAQPSSLTLSTSAFSDYTIKAISVVGYSYNGKHTYTFKVGETTVASGNTPSASGTMSISDLNATGDIELTFTHTDGRALYIKSISITYDAGTATKVETPALTASTDFYDTQEVTITCGTEDAAIVYSTDNGENWNAYSAPFSVDATTTVKARATKSGLDDSEVAEATYTKAPVCTTIEAVKALANNSKVVVSMTNWKITSISGGSMYATDGTENTLQFYGGTYTDWAVNGTISGDLKCIWTTSYDGEVKTFQNWDDVVYTDPVTTKYNITIDDKITNGTVTADMSEAYEDTKVTLTVTPDANCYLKANSLVVLDGEANEVELTQDAKDETKYIFTMPASDVEVSAEFAEKANYTITWKANGADFATTNVVEGDALVLPETNPADQGNNKFVGWCATEDYFDATTAPTYAKAGDEVNGAATYYAVYAEVAEGSIESTTVSYDTENFPTSYGTANTFTEYKLDGYKYMIQQVYKSGEKQQWRALGNKNGTGTIYNKETYPGKIMSVVVKWHSDDKNKNHTLKVGDSANPTTGTEIEGSYSELDNATTFDCSSTPSNYFVLTNGDNAGYTTSFTINYKSIAYSNFSTSVPFAATIAASGYSTFSAVCDVTIPEGVEAYYASGVSKKGLHMKPILTGKIPANTGVVLKGTASQTYTFETTTDAEAVGDNYLVATTTNTSLAPTVGTMTNYVLVDGHFCPFTGTATVAAGKAYLSLAKDDNAILIGTLEGKIILDFGDETGVAEVAGSKEQVAGNFFDLMGRKVETPVKGNIYIVNGKKYIY